MRRIKQFYHFQGDSGGPLFVTDNKGQFVQIGLVLKGDEPCGNTIDKPDIYANVGMFSDWIVSVIRKNQQSILKRQPDH